MVYDFVILGGGIAGLYTAYQLLQKNPDSKLLLLEKSARLGGRIHTYKDKYMSVEAGAGRFHSGHVRLLALIRDLGLSSHIIDIETGFKYVNVDDSVPVSVSATEPGPSSLIRHIFRESKKTDIETLRNQSFLDFAKTVVSEADVQFIEDSFGYYTELVSMNAHDALYLMSEHLSGKHQFHVLSGGLSQLIDALETKLRGYGEGVTILKRHEVKTLRCHAWSSADSVTNVTVEKFEIACKGIAKKYYGRVLIGALPKQVLEKIPMFRPLKPILELIVCGPLCRIYSKFSLNASGQPWFHDLSKITTNNKLRMVIPVNASQGILMSSYTDNKFAKYWKRLYDRDLRATRPEPVSNRCVEEQLRRQLEETTGKNVPEPIVTRVFYWDCGVGYWGVGANSSEISQMVIQPFQHNVFLCGEHFSEKNQQWIEGALETSATVVSKILGKNNIHTI
jgi:monoamine oxidase